MDDDILSQGDDREPSPWPRRLAVIAGLVAVAIAGVVYLSLPHGAHPASAAHPAPATPPAPVTASPVPQPLIEPVPVGLNGIIGRTAPWMDGLRIPVSGTQPSWFWPATGRSEAIGGLPANDAGYQFTRVGGGWAVQANGITCGDCATSPTPVWFLANGAQSATPVGTATLVAPAARADALWLTSYRPTANTATAAGVAREVSPTGALLAPQVSLPPGYVIAQATDRGLLLTPANQRPGAALYQLWNPVSAKAIRTFDGVIAANATEIAWTSRCAPTACQVRVLDLATGGQTTVALPSGKSVTGGAFSPSGQLLALQLSYGLGGGPAMRLDVASIASGRLTEVPRTSVSGDALFAFGWPAASDSLVAEFTFLPNLQLASWHPGAGRLAVAAIKPGHDQASLIVG